MLEVDRVDFSKWVQELASGHWATRRKAVVALGRLGHPQAVGVLIERLNDRSFQVRRAAALALARMGDVSAIPPLIALLQDRDQRVRETAHKALIQLGSAPLADLLLGALETGATHTQRMALAGLVDLGSPEPLGKALVHPDVVIRLGALVALGRLKAIPSLVRALDDAAPEVRREAVAALARLRRKDALVLNALARATHDVDPRVRARAAQALCRQRRPLVVQPLLRALQSPDAQVRLSVVSALGRLGAVANVALAPLQQRLQEDDSFWVRRRCRAAMRQITQALRNAPHELVAAPAPEGIGTELEAAKAPEGWGTEPVGAEEGDPPQAREHRPWWSFRRR